MTPKRIAALGVSIAFAFVIAWFFFGNRNDKLISTVGNNSEILPDKPGQLKRDAKHKFASMMKKFSVVRQNIEDSPEKEADLSDFENDENEFAEAVERSKKVDFIFANENRDPEWAEQMEVRIANLITNGDFKESRIIDSMCKTSFCRVEVHHDKIEGRDDFERIVSLYDGGTFLQHLELNADRSSNSVVYFVRPEMQEHNVVYKLMHQESL